MSEQRFGDRPDGPALGGEQQIPRPAQVRIGPGPWWNRPGAVPPSSVTATAVRAAFAPHPTSSDGFAPAGSDGPGEDRGRRRQPVDLAQSVVPIHPPRPPEIADERILAPGRRPASVLCALFDDATCGTGTDASGHEGEVAVVLTRRSSALRTHTGEVAFPGGRLDPGETAVQAALREAHEEVGIDPAGVEVLGLLPPMATHDDGSAITPVVGVLPGPPVLRPNPDEVERVFTVRLSDLLRPGIYHEELWRLDSPAGDLAVTERAIHFFDLPGDMVWGATARMLVELFERICPEPA